MLITAYRLFEFLAEIENIQKLYKIQLYLILITEHQVTTPLNGFRVQYTGQDWFQSSG